MCVVGGEGVFAGNFVLVDDVGCRVRLGGLPGGGGREGVYLGGFSWSSG